MQIARWVTMAHLLAINYDDADEDATKLDSFKIFTDYLYVSWEILIYGDSMIIIYGWIYFSRHINRLLPYYTAGSKAHKVHRTLCLRSKTKNLIKQLTKCFKN